MSQTPNPNQQNMIQMIQPAQATRLLDALKEELALGKAAGADTAKARHHLQKANQIKQVLLNYQQQQKAAQARAAASPQAQTPLAGAALAPQQTSATTTQNTGVPAQQMASFPAAGTAARPGGAAPSTPAVSGALGASGVTTDKYNQVRARILDLERKVRALEATRRPDMSADERAQLDNQLNECRLKQAQYSKFALYMRNQLMEQARAASPPAPTTSAATPGANSATVATPATTNAAVAVANANVAANDASRSGSGANTGTGTPRGRSASPAPKDGVPGVSLVGITKPSVPLMPILSTISVSPPSAVVMKAGGNNPRPTLTGGGASGLGPMMGTPAVVRMPTFDMASTGPIPDSSGRVLTKRKLTELVNTIGADEGDGKTTVDGDVEELLLDLADEFVLLVTTFACRLAKHRKTESVDVRDVQLHLERNWNIRVPGHAMDEIRGVRKWQPSSSYNQKVSGVEIAKAVNGNMS